MNQPATARTKSRTMDISYMNLLDLQGQDQSVLASAGVINASNNMLSMATFHSLKSLEVLNLSLNQLYALSPWPDGFVNLRHLDLSFNFLEGSALLQLGLLPNLSWLSMTGNGIRRLPLDLAEPKLKEDGAVEQRFPMLEVLQLDDNKLSRAEDFASLATLPKLRVLNVANNLFQGIPLLRSATSIRVRKQITPERSITVDKKDAALMSGKQRKHIEQNSDCSSADQSVIDLRGPTRPPISLFALQPSMRKPMDQLLFNTASEPVENPNARLVVVVDPKPQQKTLIGQRSPLAPRVRIVDEFVGQADVKRIFRLRERLLAQRRGSVSRLENPHTASSQNRLTMVNTVPPITGKGASHWYRTGTKWVDGSRKSQMLSKSSSNSSTKPDNPLCTSPFPTLQCVDLSNNQIAFEERLLPVATWLELRELVLFNNPVVTGHSGTPPLLRKLLVQSLKIKLRCTAESSSDSDPTAVKDVHSLNSDASSTPKRPPVLLTKVSGPQSTVSCKQGLSAAQKRIRRESQTKRPTVNPVVAPMRSKPSNQGLKAVQCASDRLAQQSETTPGFQPDRRTLQSPALSCDTVRSKIQLDQRHLERDIVVPLSNSPSSQLSTNESLSGWGDSDSVTGDQPSMAQLTDFVDDHRNHTCVHQPISASGFIISDQTESDSMSPSPGPILPGLPWLVDEKNLPECIQVCLGELRHLKQQQLNLCSSVTASATESTGHDARIRGTLTVKENEKRSDSDVQGKIALTGTLQVYPHKVLPSAPISATEFKPLNTMSVRNSPQNAVHTIVDQRDTTKSNRNIRVLGEVKKTD
ncbi:X-ray radiation resistance-associated protein 1 [Clonorchis sinensis]|uniref:X-ray radiation resistance-associated protein 1 n=1 Tax=Clonorchis sinensis TaxID=79923 RepID=A0A8T1LX74_CLOSI|nr:X-ray radiation resistance-associated protein 1 [Clonorchis sinensis]